MQEKANRSAFEDSIEYRSNLQVDKHGHGLSTVIDRNLLFLCFITHNRLCTDLSNHEHFGKS